LLILYYISTSFYVENFVLKNKHLLESIGKKKYVAVINIIIYYIVHACLKKWKIGNIVKMCLNGLILFFRLPKTKFPRSSRWNILWYLFAWIRCILSYKHYRKKHYFPMININVINVWDLLKNRINRLSFLARVRCMPGQVYANIY